jgi:hypothetical protein
MLYIGVCIYKVLSSRFEPKKGAKAYLSAQQNHQWVNILLGPAILVMIA